MNWTQNSPGRHELTETPLGKRQQAFALELGPVYLITANFDPNDMNGDGSNLILDAPLASVAFRNDLVLPGGREGDGGGLAGPLIYVRGNDGVWHTQ